MKVNFHKPLSSYVTTIVLLLIYAVALAAATFIEKYHGTATAKRSSTIRLCSFCFNY